MPKPPPPLWLLAEVTHSCPLQCPYCSNPLDLIPKKDELDTENWLGVLHEARQIGAAIPPKFREVADDVEAKVKAVLQAKLSQLDFVSREEFDVQRQVLLRTREKLEALEIQVQQLLVAQANDDQDKQ